MKRKLEIIPVGSQNFPRRIIRNDAGEVFDGEKMVADCSKAMLFTEGQDIAFAYNAIQAALYADCPFREFSVSMDIRVRTKEPFTKEDLEKYLEQVTTILLDQEKGDGPLADGMVQLGVTWAGLTEKGGRKKS